MLSTAQATHQAKYFQVINYAFFFGLCGLSVYFMHGVLEKFFSGKTSFSQSEETINELPTITICFIKPNLIKPEYEYGLDFKIQYLIYEKHDISLQYNYSIFLKEGENLVPFGEILWLEKIITLNDGNCFKLTSVLTKKYIMKSYTFIRLYFNDSITEEDFPISAEIFVTSEKNSYGVVLYEWKNGEIIHESVYKNMNKGINLKPVQYNYLTKTFKCSYESYYECMTRLIAASLNGSSSQCGLFSLPSLPVCKINKTNVEEKEFLNALRINTDQCSIKLCATLEYSATQILNYGLIKTNITFQFAYNIPSNKTTLYEEYMIYDAINAIGSVGGTLGMCIGFSFYGLISSFINILQHVKFNANEKIQE